MARLDTRSNRRVLSASTMIGNKVTNPQNENIGKIEEIMIDVEGGKVAYAVLSFGGFLGVGNKLFAVPWGALTLSTQDHEFVLDVEKETLKNAPGFDKNEWPDLSDPALGTRIHEYYGTSYSA